MRQTLLRGLLRRLPDLWGPGKAPNALGYSRLTRMRGRKGGVTSWILRSSSILAMPPDPSVSSPASDSVRHLLGPSLGRSCRLWQKCSLTSFSWNFFPSCLRYRTEMFSFTCVNLGVIHSFRLKKPNPPILKLAQPAGSQQLVIFIPTTSHYFSFFSSKPSHETPFWDPKPTWIRGQKKKKPHLLFQFTATQRKFTPLYLSPSCSL